MIFHQVWFATKYFVECSKKGFRTYAKLKEVSKPNTFLIYEPRLRVYEKLKKDSQRNYIILQNKLFNRAGFLNRQVAIQ
jgi:hypothetical protein